MVAVIAAICSVVTAICTVAALWYSRRDQAGKAVRAAVIKFGDLHRIRLINGDGWEIVGMSSDDIFGIPDAYEPDGYGNDLPSVYRWMDRYTLPVPSDFIDVRVDRNSSISLKIKRTSSISFPSSLPVLIRV